MNRLIAWFQNLLLPPFASSEAKPLKARFTATPEPLKDWATPEERKQIEAGADPAMVLNRRRNRERGYLPLVAFLLLSLSGCGPVPANSEREAAIARRELAEITNLLPPNSSKVTRLGNQWFTFELELGTTRKYLINYQVTHGGYRAVAITELR